MIRPVKLSGAADSIPLFNRELSWLAFNRRVLAQARRGEHRLLERAKFLAITSSNLDEFYEVRVASLKDQFDAGVTHASPDGRSPGRQLSDVSEAVAALVLEQETVYHEELVPDLRAEGIEFMKWDELDVDARKRLSEWFEHQVFPVLTPLAVDRAHPFPYISNLSLNLAVLVVDPESGEERFARVKVPPRLPRYVSCAEGDRFILLEDVIASQLGQLFPGMEIGGYWTFRVTRSTDLDDIDNEDSDDLLAAMELELQRRRFGSPVRLEVHHAVPPHVLALLREEHDLDDGDVTYHRAPIDLRGLFDLLRLDRPDLKDDAQPLSLPARLTSAPGEKPDIFSAIAQGDLLLHHPYESFAATVEEFVRQAAEDPNVLTIKMTLYRTSFDSEIAQLLAMAAQRGVQVAVLVELKARFDEAVNISWARRLEQAGVHVVYGVPGLKTHAKCILVVRAEGDRLRSYAHIGTGNYNSRTARTYEDLGLMTVDPAITDDLVQLFNYLTGYCRPPSFDRILTAPTALRARLQELTANEAHYGVDGRIVIKVNGLTDPALIDSLYAASQAGVSIDLVVRGMCALVPGLPGLSETINVRSIVGRYLEHSRIYFFANGNGQGHPLWFIGSADAMPRNLDRRVEVIVPVHGADQTRRLAGILRAALADGRRSWLLTSEGQWTRAGASSPAGMPLLDAQLACSDLARPKVRWSAPDTGVTSG